MKFSEFLKEDKYSNILSLYGRDKKTLIAVLQKLEKELETKYSDFYELYNRDLKIFRGVKEISNDRSILCTYGEIRPDRKPLHMEEDFHNLINHVMANRLNLKATRGNSLFCSSYRETASEWGIPCILFVENGYQGTVFEGVRDDYVFNKLRNLTYDDYDDFTDTREDDEDDEDNVSMEDKVYKTLKNLSPFAIKDKFDLATVMRKHFYDILITGKSYICIKTQLADILLDNKTDAEEKLDKLLLRTHFHLDDRDRIVDNDD